MSYFSYRKIFTVIFASNSIDCHYEKTFLAKINWCVIITKVRSGITCCFCSLFCAEIASHRQEESCTMFMYVFEGGAKHHRQKTLPQIILKKKLRRVYALVQLPTVHKTLWSALPLDSLSRGIFTSYLMAVATPTATISTVHQVER